MYKSTILSNASTIPGTPVNFVEVIFRKYKDSNSIIAIFPYELTPQGDVTYRTLLSVYTSEYKHLMSITNPAKPNEYDMLHTQLSNQGYTILPVKSRYTKKVN